MIPLVAVLLAIIIALLFYAASVADQRDELVDLLRNIMRDAKVLERGDQQPLLIDDAALKRMLGGRRP